MVMLTGCPTIAVVGELLMVGELGARLGPVTVIVRLLTELPAPLVSKVVAQMVFVPGEVNTKQAVVLLPPLAQLDTYGLLLVRLESVAVAWIFTGSPSGSLPRHMVMHTVWPTIAVDGELLMVGEDGALFEK